MDTTNNNKAVENNNNGNTNPPSIFRVDGDTTVNSVNITPVLPMNNPSNAPTTIPVTSDIFVQFAEKIIKEQESIIGPIAYEQASKVPGLLIDLATHSVKMEGDKKAILENLVKQYELLFGRVSIEICKEAVRGVITEAPIDQVPQILL